MCVTTLSVVRNKVRIKSFSKIEQSRTVLNLNRLKNLPLVCRQVLVHEVQVTYIPRTQKWYLVLVQASTDWIYPTSSINTHTDLTIIDPTSDFFISTRETANTLQIIKRNNSLILRIWFRRIKWACQIKYHHSSPSLQ